MITFKDVIQNYVIFDTSMHYFVGPHPFGERCFLKAHASRYTKDEAVTFINKQRIPDMYRIQEVP